MTLVFLNYYGAQCYPTDQRLPFKKVLLSEIFCTCTHMPLACTHTNTHRISIFKMIYECFINLLTLRNNLRNWSFLHRLKFNNKRCIPQIAKRNFIFFLKRTNDYSFWKWHLQLQLVIIKTTTEVGHYPKTNTT